jgi:hypothetical protein
MVAELDELGIMGHLVGWRYLMPTVKKASHRGRGGPVAAPGAIVIRETIGRTAARAVAGAEIGLDQRIWKGVMTRKGALKKVLTGFGEAVQRSEDLGAGVRLTVVIGPRGEAPTIEIEEVHARANPATTDQFDAALAEARARGVQRAAEILTSPEMLSADGFAEMIGVSREAVRLKRQRHEILGLEGAKRGVRFPQWQVTADGSLLPGLSSLFDRLAGNSWTVYRFLIQRHPELDGVTAAAALKAGQVDKVLAAAENAGRAFS